MKFACLLALLVSLFGACAVFAAPALEDDVPEIADPSWATGIRDQLDNDQYDEALAALQKLAAKHAKTFQYHTLTAEAYEGKYLDAEDEKDEIRWLKKARESYLKAESLATGKDKADVKKLRELVEADLKDLGVTIRTPTGPKPKPAPAKGPAKPAAKKGA